MAIIDITTNNSKRVKPLRELLIVNCLLLVDIFRACPEVTLLRGKDVALASKQVYFRVHLQYNLSYNRLHYWYLGPDLPDFPNRRIMCILNYPKH